MFIPSSKELDLATDIPCEIGLDGTNCNGFEL